MGGSIIGVIVGVMGGKEGGLVVMVVGGRLGGVGHRHSWGGLEEEPEVVGPVERWTWKHHHLGGGHLPQRCRRQL